MRMSDATKLENAVFGDWCKKLVGCNHAAIEFVDVPLPWHFLQAQGVMVGLLGIKANAGQITCEAVASLSVNTHAITVQRVNANE